MSCKCSSFKSLERVVAFRCLDDESILMSRKPLDHVVRARSAHELNDGKNNNSKKRCGDVEREHFEKQCL